MELIKWVRLQWDRSLGALAMAVGVVLLIIGWIQVSSTEFVSQQIPYVVSAGLGGIVALLIGGTLWLSADLRDEWRELHRIDERLAEGDEVVDGLLARVSEPRDPARRTRLERCSGPPHPGRRRPDPERRVTVAGDRPPAPGRVAPRLPDLLGPVVVIVVGVALVLVGWVGAAAQDTVSPQLAFANVGVSGVVLVGVGCAIHLLNLRRAVRRQRLDVTGHRRLTG